MGNDRVFPEECIEVAELFELHLEDEPGLSVSGNRIHLDKNRVSEEVFELFSEHDALNLSLQDGDVYYYNFAPPNEDISINAILLYLHTSSK